MSGLGPFIFTSLLASASPVLFLALIALLVMRGRAPEARPGPTSYFFYGVALACLVLGVFSAGFLVHSVSSLVGPTPGGSGISTGISQSVTGTTDFIGTGNGNPFVAPGDTTAIHNQYTSDAVLGLAFLAAAAIGFWLVWPRALRETDRPAVRDLALRYDYLVAGLSALALLIFAPLAVDSIFRGIAPGVAGAAGHAEGVRNVFSFGVVSALLAGILVYHLRYAGDLRAGEAGIAVEDPESPATPDDGEYFQAP